VKSEALKRSGLTRRRDGLPAAGALEKRGAEVERQKCRSAVTKKRGGEKAARKGARAKRKGGKLSGADMKRLAYAREFVARGSKTAAYKEVFPAAKGWSAGSVANEAYKYHKHAVVQGEIARLDGLREADAVAGAQEVLRFFSDVLRGEGDVVIKVLVDPAGKELAVMRRPPNVAERLAAGAALLKVAPLKVQESGTMVQLDDIRGAE